MYRPSPRLPATITLLLGFLLALAGCRTQSSNVLGEAYVAPATLNLRHDLTQKTNTVAVLKHRDHLAITDIRRRFVKVRTDKGLEGWVDSAQLLSPEQMEQIRRDTQKALALPSQGSATVFEALNVHIEPSRQSPAFAKIPEAGSVSVLAHKLVPKTTGPAPASSFSLLKPQQSSRRQRKEKQSKFVSSRPPRPPAPKAPDNWQDLSSERIDGLSTADAKAKEQAAQAAKKTEEPKKPVVMENWTLVRTRDKECGWVLSRNLIMSIPDEVAQYAEGKHITSYFDLGTVKDEEKGVKHHWLWTTANSGLPYDFDGWRVFLWNRRRHRYETSFRQRNVEGYFPVHVDAAESATQVPTFELITKDDDAKFRRRTYNFDGARVHLIRTEDYQPGSSVEGKGANGINIEQIQSKAPQSGWFRRQWNAIMHRITGRPADDKDRPRH
jgi:hypothetical protein